MNKTYPIAETFLAPQGEGFWTGTLMRFIRFAGCNMGKPFTLLEKPQGIADYQEKCVSACGDSFACDTNYRKAKTMSVEEILLEIGNMKRVLLTGGEPLLHDLSPLLHAIPSKVRVHVETSGTFDTREIRRNSISPWICVSPKFGCMQESIEDADEIKILVGVNFDEMFFLRTFSNHLDRVYLSPINGEKELNRENMARCLDLQRKYPQVRLTLQTHKIWGTR